MKKLQKSVVAAAMAMLMLSACSNDAMENNIENLSDISEANLETHIENAGQSAENVLDKTVSAEHPEQTGNSKILIAYFSRWGNTNYPDDVDATTSVDVSPFGRVTSDLSLFENLSCSEEITFSLAE